MTEDQKFLLAMGIWWAVSSIGLIVALVFARRDIRRRGSAVKAAKGNG